MAITASMVKELRERTGAGMMECKKALVEADGDMDAAAEALRKAGAAHGLKIFGARAVESMRLDKGFLHWKADLLTEFDPFETGLPRFVKMDKGPFIGQDALRERQKETAKKTFVSLAIGTTKAPAHGGGSLMSGDKVVGTITSGDWGHRVGKNLAYAFVDVAFGKVGSEMTLDLCGDHVPAKVIAPSPYDPDHSLMRG